MKINNSLFFFKKFLFMIMNNKINIIAKKSWSFWAEIKYIIKGHERMIREKFLCFFRLRKIKKTNVIIFSCDPKLSDFKIGEIKSKISELDNSVNSKFCCKLIFSKPSKNIVVGKNWYIEILSASERGKIDIKKRKNNNKKIIFWSILYLKFNFFFIFLKFLKRKINWIKRIKKNVSFKNW